MSDKEPEEKDGLLELIKKLWLPVAGFFGAVTLAYNFYLLWLRDQATVSLFLLIGLAIILIVILAWIGFGVKKNIKNSDSTKTPIVEIVARFPLSYRVIAWCGIVGVILSTLVWWKSYAIVYNNAGSAYADEGNYQRAIQEYTSSIYIDQSDAITYYNRGNAYYAIEEYERAIQDYNQSLYLSPQFVLAYYGRASTYRHLDNYQYAIMDYGQIIQINPQDAQAYYGRGVLFREVGDYQNALDDFTRSIQINSQHALSYYNRGVIYLVLGKTTEAESDFAKYKELTGQDAP